MLAQCWVDVIPRCPSTGPTRQHNIKRDIVVLMLGRRYRRWSTWVHHINTQQTYWPDAGSMLGWRRRRWTDIDPALCRYVVFVRQPCILAGTQYVGTMLFKCWASVADRGPA